MGESMSKDNFTVGKLADKYKNTPDLPVTETEEYREYVKIKVEKSKEYKELEQKNLALKSNYDHCRACCSSLRETLSKDTKDQFDKTAGNIVSILQKTEESNIQTKSTYDSIYSQARLDYGNLVRDNKCLLNVNHTHNVFNH